MLRKQYSPAHACKSTLYFVVTLLFSSLVSPVFGASGLSDIDCVVEPSVIADVGSAVPGLLEKVHFDQSDYVSKGTVLAELEAAVEKASLNLADRMAKLSTALELRQLNAGFGKRTRERNQALFQNSSISSQTMDQVKTESRIASLQVRQELENQELAQLEVSRAKAILDRRTIVSPIEGAIMRRYRTVGEYVEGEPVFKIAQLHPLHIDVIVPLDNLGEITSGMRGTLKLDVPGYRDKELTATVHRIDPVADAASGTYGVRLLLPNPDLKIPSGVRCKVDFKQE